MVKPASSVLAACLNVKQGKEVEYSLRAIPLGGYVAFPDDDPSSTYKPDDPDLLRNRGILSRAMVISAGVIANLIFAYAVLFAQVSGGMGMSFAAKFHAYARQ
jgi:membrane-associated protease RseP (regulator of RpoE activity)